MTGVLVRMTELGTIEGLDERTDLKGVGCTFCQCHGDAACP